MKKVLSFVGALAASPLVALAAEGDPDWSAADTVVTAGQTALNTFVSTNAPIIGKIVIGLLVIPMIFVVAKLFRRAGKQV